MLATETVALRCKIENRLNNIIDIIDIMMVYTMTVDTAYAEI